VAGWLLVKMGLGIGDDLCQLGAAAHAIGEQRGDRSRISALEAVAVDGPVACGRILAVLHAVQEHRGDERRGFLDAGQVLSSQEDGRQMMPDDVPTRR
jgi:hypothetical protein